MKATAVFKDYSIVGISSEDPDYLAESLKVYESSTESWRSVNTTAQALTLDLGGAIEDPVVLIYGANFQIVRFLGNATDDWGAPAFTSADVTLEQDPDDTLRKRAVTLTGFNYRHLRVEIPNQAADQGASYFEVGVLAVFETLEDFGVYAGGFEAPEMQQIQAEALNRFETNRKEVIPLAPHPVLELQLSGTMLNSVVNRQKVNRVFGDPLRNLVYMDRAGEGNTWQVYLAQRTGGMTMSEVAPGNSGARRYSGVWETIL